MPNVEYSNWKVHRTSEENALIISCDQGVFVTVPQKHYHEIEGMVIGGCTKCINDYIQTLPKNCIFTEKN